MRTRDHVAILVAGLAIAVEVALWATSAQSQEAKVAPGVAAPAGVVAAGAAPAGVVAAGAAPAAAPAGAAPAAAPAAGAAPITNAALDAWISQTLGKIGSFPRSLAFVTSLPEKGKGDPVYLAIDTAAFNKLSYMQAVNQSNADWNYKLNRAAYAAMDSLASVLALTKADSVVFAPDKGEWKLLRPIPGNGRNVLFSAKPPKSTAPEDILAWLMAGLGWDGVIIDQKGDILLVGSTVGMLSVPQLQALAIADSAQKITLMANDRKGAGLLSLAAISGGYGAFETIFLGQGVTSLPLGTKLVIEKKK
jgi:hypothetical protein